MPDSIVMKVSSANWKKGKKNHRKTSKNGNRARKGMQIIQQEHHMLLEVEDAAPVLKEEKQKPKNLLICTALRIVSA